MTPKKMEELARQWASIATPEELEEMAEEFGSEMMLRGGNIWLRENGPATKQDALVHGAAIMVYTSARITASLLQIVKGEMPEMLEGDES